MNRFADQRKIVELLRLAKVTLGELACKYFRVSVQGISNLPRRGPFMVVSNHSGFLGLDGMVLSHVLESKRGRMPFVLANQTFFTLNPSVSFLAKAVGLRPASYPEGLDILKHGKPLILFPEAEQGNFKSSVLRYQLQRFRTGCIRLAAETHVPVIPCLIVGAEETLFNAGKLDLNHLRKHLFLPIPINWVPLPSKWILRFLPPFEVPAKNHRLALKSTLEAQKLADRLRAIMQRHLKAILKKRSYIYHPKEPPEIRQLLAIR
jgi:1-acyl-sn-glycerol-3-phosphate acyltransferase